MPGKHHGIAPLKTADQGIQALRTGILVILCLAMHFAPPMADYFEKTIG